MSESPKKTYFGLAFIYLFTFQTQQSATFGKSQQASGVQNNFKAKKNIGNGSFSRF